MTAFARFFGNCKNHLTRISEKEPLALFSLFLIVLFDIFLFSIIADGLGKATKTIDSPSAYAGYSCLNLLDSDKIENEESRNQAIIGSIRNISSYRDYDSYMDSSAYPYDYNGYGNGCETIRTALREAQSDQGFSRLTLQLDSLEKQISGNTTEQSDLRANYQTKLLEKTAGQKIENSIYSGSADTAASSLSSLKSKETSLKQERSNTIRSIMAISSVKRTVEVMNTSKSTIRSTFDRLSFWYPVKTFGMELIFLLPVFIAGLFWVRRSSQKSKDIQALVGSHVLAVLSVFGLIKAIEFIYDILPHKFIAEVIDFLESWNIIELWYYILILLSIGGCLFAVYIVQKKILNPARQEAKRVASGRCRRCGLARQTDSEFCPYCGTNYHEKCEGCHQSKLAWALHCNLCGKGEEK